MSSLKRTIDRKHRLIALSLSSDVEVREAGGMSTITVTIAATPDRGTILPTESQNILQGSSDARQQSRSFKRAGL